MLRHSPLVVRPPKSVTPKYNPHFPNRLFRGALAFFVLCVVGMRKLPITIILHRYRLYEETEESRDGKFRLRISSINPAFHKCIVNCRFYTSGDLFSWQKEQIQHKKTNHPFYCQYRAVYEYATQFTQGQRVLDLGCGEGYGAHLLAQHAKEVVAVDKDKKTIQQAKQKYNLPNLDFYIQDVSQLHKYFPLWV